MNFDLQIQKPLRELVYEELKHKILTGEIASQTRLMEIDLAEKMNVSRTPIREAIRELAADGLVTIEPRRGAYVSRISIDDMLDAFEVRENLEGFAAYLAAKRINEEQKVKLKELMDLYEEAINNDEKKNSVERDESLHKFIVECGGNKTLQQMVNHVQELSLRFRYLYYDDFSHYKKMPAQHRLIVEAIVSGDCDKARLESEEHVRKLKQYIYDLDRELNGNEH